jgi:hypothetical protein
MKLRRPFRWGLRPVNIKKIRPRLWENRRDSSERGYYVDTTKIEDRQERKKVKRTARKKAAPKGKQTEPRGSLKRKVKKLARGQSKR